MSIDSYVPATLAEQKEANETQLTTLRAAVQWHLSGADWATIAERFKYSSPQAARVAVEKFEGDMVSDTDVVASRNKAAARYERLLRTEWEDAITPYLLDKDGKRTSKRNPNHAAAWDRVRSVVGDLVRLQGAAMPTQLQLYVPGSEELMTVVNELRAAKLGEIAQEADIFDAEVVEDDEDGES